MAPVGMGDGGLSGGGGQSGKVLLSRGSGAGCIGGRNMNLGAIWGWNCQHSMEDEEDGA